MSKYLDSIKTLQLGFIIINEAFDENQKNNLKTAGIAAGAGAAAGAYAGSKPGQALINRMSQSVADATNHFNGNNNTSHNANAADATTAAASKFVGYTKRPVQHGEMLRPDSANINAGASNANIINAGANASQQLNTNTSNQNRLNQNISNTTTNNTSQQQNTQAPINNQQQPNSIEPQQSSTDTAFNQAVNDLNSSSPNLNINPNIRPEVRSLDASASKGSYLDKDWNPTKNTDFQTAENPDNSTNDGINTLNANNSNSVNMPNPIAKPTLGLNTPKPIDLNAPRMDALKQVAGDSQIRDYNNAIQTPKNALFQSVGDKAKYEKLSPEIIDYTKNAQNYYQNRIQQLYARRNELTGVHDQVMSPVDLANHRYRSINPISNTMNSIHDKIFGAPDYVKQAGNGPKELNDINKELGSYGLNPYDPNYNSKVANNFANDMAQRDAAKKFAGELSQQHHLLKNQGVVNAQNYADEELGIEHPTYNPQQTAAIPQVAQPVNNVTPPAAPVPTQPANSTIPTPQHPAQPMDLSNVRQTFGNGTPTNGGSFLDSLHFGV